MDTRIGSILFHQQQLERIGAIHQRIDTTIITLDRITDTDITQHHEYIGKYYREVIILGIAGKRNSDIIRYDREEMH